jgi:hypothetical protein
MRDVATAGAIAALLVLPAAASAHDIDSGGSADLLHRLTEPIPAATGAQSGAALPLPLAGASGSFELVGHSPLRNRGMNAAHAVWGDYAYVGSRSDGTHLDAGVLVVDVSAPADPRVVGEIGPPNEGNVGETSREMRILPDQQLLAVLNHACSEAIHRCASPSLTGASQVRSSYRFYDISGENARAPKLVSTYLPSRSQPQTPHEFFLWSDPLRPGRVLIYQTTPSSDSSGRENLIVTDVSRVREGEFAEIAKWTTRIDNPQRDNRLHSLTVSNDGRRAQLAYLGGGFLVLDTSDVAEAKPEPELRLATPVANRVFWTNPGAHSAIKLWGKQYTLVTDEVYGKLGVVLPEHGCPWGWVRMVDIRNEAAPRVAAEYRHPSNDPEVCRTVSRDDDNLASFSAHNPTLTPNLALITWHSAGFQAIDISDPERPAPAAEYMPQPLANVQTEDPALSSGRQKVVMWSFPIIKDGLIYVIDVRNGLYILRYRGPHQDEVSSTRFLDGNSNSGDALRFEPVGAPARPAAAAPACLRRPVRLRRRAVGRIRLGASRDSVIRRAGLPSGGGGRSLSYCVAGGGDVLVALSRAGRARLVVTSARGRRAVRGARGVRPGARVRRLRRAYPALRRAGRGVLVARGPRRLFVVRRRRVTHVGVAAARVLASRRVLRGHLRNIGIGRRSPGSPPLLRR